MKSSVDLESYFDEWAGPHSVGRAPRAWGLFGLCVGLAGMLLAVLVGWAAGPWGASLAVAGVVAIAAATLAAQRRTVLATAGARRLHPGEEPRLVNLVAGLAEDARIPVPELMIATRPGPNALVWAGRRPVLVVTADMVGEFALTELEAVVAHCLLRLRSPSARALAPAVLLSRVGLGRPMGKGRMVSVGDDVRAAALTRYPPALASAIAKCTPERGGVGPAYFVAEGPSHLPVPERLAALSDL